MKHILCMGRARPGPGPCKGYVLYMDIYIYICIYILSYIVICFLILSCIILHYPKRQTHPGEACDSSSLPPQASLGQPPKKSTPPGEARDNSNLPPRQVRGWVITMECRVA